MSNLVDHQFNINHAREALTEILRLIDEDSKLKQAKETSSNDMLKYMQNFLPLAMEVQYRLIEKYGFTPDSSGLMNFTNRVKEMCGEDDTVSGLFDKFKSILIPPFSLRKINV